MSAFRAADHTADHPATISHAGSLSLLDLRRCLPELAGGIFVNKDRGLPNSYVKQAGGNYSSTNKHIHSCLEGETSPGESLERREDILGKSRGRMSGLGRHWELMNGILNHLHHVLLNNPKPPAIQFNLPLTWFSCFLRSICTTSCSTSQAFISLSIQFDLPITSSLALPLLTWFS